ncbi:tRNA (guanosine(37)-N1)-methyltransferase TrmD [Marinicella sp. W31]|uniref:tRNA (guanosine(37)-N1)-methyltransferase TrmD n=1 Tax=Marinicella sp. W31 TaxID=3023713 RepID=UPI0037570BB3
MRFNIITLFPEMVEQVMSYGVIGRAWKKGLIEVVSYNPRDYAEDRHRTVDDKPFGGGPGMVMMYDPLFRVVEELRAEKRFEGLDFLTPHGQTFNQEMAKNMAARQVVTLLCGRYEGVDQRFVDQCVDREISIGDFVVSGGELPACMVIDAVARLLPGVLGDDASSATDSFMQAQLGYPQYTRSEILGQSGVPDVLLSGHHERIEQWRMQEAERITRQKRPDLLAGTSGRKKNDPCSDENK